MENLPWIILIILVLLILFYGRDMLRWACERAGTPKYPIPDDDIRREHFINDPKAGSADTYQPQAPETLAALGYSSPVPWQDVIKATELDPATFINHEEFVKDVRRFSSGANFTSVTDDNTNLAFVNFQGLRRPEHVKIGSGARQIPDVDETVLQRNKPFRWNSTS